MPPFLTCKIIVLKTLYHADLDAKYRHVDGIKPAVFKIERLESD